MIRVCVVAVIVALTPVFVVAAPASAATVTTTLRFTELSPTQANGLHTSGLRFGFTVGGSNSKDATYGGSGPGTTKYVSEPCLEGNAGGQLTLTFDLPTTLLQFGLALATGGSLSPGFTVDLFDRSGTSLGSFPVDTQVYGHHVYTEARFTKKGLAIKKAVITFDDSDAPRFALDNLSYKTPA